jgi:hypothetical protein
VLGASGEADLKHHILGSVSTKVAQHAPCSVFVANHFAHVTLAAGVDHLLAVK